MSHNRRARFVGAAVAACHRHLRFDDLSPSAQGHLISLKYLQQASGPDHHFIAHPPSIHPSLQHSHHPSRAAASSSTVKVKSN